MDELRNRSWLQNPVTSKDTYGFHIYLNPKDVTGVCPSIATTGIHELHVTELFRKIVRRGMVVVDVGANVGWYSLLAATIVGDTGAVIAFEPEPNNFELLKKSIQRNGFKQITPIRSCLSNVNGKATLWLNPTNLGAHTTIHDQYVEGGIQVPTNRLDAILKDMKVYHVDVLKIDAEGAEPQVLEGAGNYLGRADPVFMEWNRGSWNVGDPILETLTENYQAYKVLHSPLLRKSISFKELFDLKLCNLYFRNRDNAKPPCKA